jgi:hypothetical protein
MSLKTPGVQPDDLLAEGGRKVMGFHYAAMLRHEQGHNGRVDIEDARYARRHPPHAGRFRGL